MQRTPVAPARNPDVFRAFVNSLIILGVQLAVKGAKRSCRQVERLLLNARSEMHPLAWFALQLPRDNR